jgi:hypothetical protein
LLAALLLLPALVTFLFPATGSAGPAPAGSPLCYNKLAGSLPIVCLAPTSTTLINGETGKKFENSKCYTFADVSKGWVEDSCEADVFKQALRGTAPIAAADDPAHKCTGSNCDIVAKVLNPIINFLAAAVGIVVTIVIIIGGIQYGASGDDPQKVAQAKGRIYNGLLALGGFMFLWAGLNWLVPGGPF